MDLAIYIEISLFPHYEQWVWIYNVAVSANQQKTDVADGAGNTEKSEVCSNDEIL